VLVGFVMFIDLKIWILIFMNGCLGKNKAHDHVKDPNSK